MTFDGDLSPNQDRNVDNPEWITAKTRGRWAPYWNAQTRTYAPPSSPRRTKARRDKYAFVALTMRGGPEHVDLSQCMTGDELLAEHKRGRVRGDGTSFRLEPRTDEARELVALLPWRRLHWNDARLLVALSYAMVERKRPGLVASAVELGTFLGLGKTATKDALARLVALGWLQAKPTHTQFGACWSQRANLWRLTAQAFAAWDLEAPRDGIAVPTGTVDRARLQRRRTYTVGSRALATGRNPDAIPEVVLTTPAENPGSFRNGGRSSSSEIDGPTTATGAVGPARRQDETRHAPQRAPEGKVSPARAAARAELDAWKRDLELRPEVEAREARERAHAQQAANRAELAKRAAARAWIASDEFSPAAFAALVSDPAAKQAILDAQRPRTLDDSELRFALLDLHDEPSKDGAS